MSIEVLQGDSLTVLKTLPDCSVHMVVTSPPYWALRDYGVAGQLGLEPIHDCLGWATGARCGECYICHMVEVFREVRRVLRDDGTCWVNEGDSYNSQGGTGPPRVNISACRPSECTGASPGGLPAASARPKAQGSVHDPLPSGACDAG